MYILDINFFLDAVTKRTPRHRDYSKIIRFLIKTGMCALSSSSLHSLEYILKKHYPDALRKYRSLLPHLLIIKTPSYIDHNSKLARHDIDDYLIALSAQSCNGFVITNDKDFLRLSDVAVNPDDAIASFSEKKQSIQFIDLKRQYLRLYSSVERNIDFVLAHGQFILGPEIKDVEERLAAYVGVRHCISMASGTDALLIAMMALGVKSGDEVITTPFTFIATAETIALLGARPVFVDIDPRTYNIDPALVEKAITKKTKAIMPVSLYGQCADMDTLNGIALRYELPVIEDAAQSFGATYKGKRSCGLSTIGCTSFFPSKPLGCYGDGGACFTDDDELARKMREIRVHGQDRRYHHPIIGVNGRMDTIQAAVVLAKMEVFEEEVKLRGDIGSRYTELLKDCVVTPYIEPFNVSVYAQYTIQVDDREKLQKKLNEQGIPTAVHYPIPLNLQPAFAYLGQGPGAFPVAEAAARRVMSLPMHPYLSEEEMDRVVKVIVKADIVSPENRT